nr:hypothetical protein CFP56_36455 [Quercus suber]
MTSAALPRPHDPLLSHTTVIQATYCSTRCRSPTFATSGRPRNVDKAVDGDSSDFQHTVHYRRDVASAPSPWPGNGALLFLGEERRSRVNPAAHAMCCPQCATVRFDFHAVRMASIHHRSPAAIVARLARCSPMLLSGKVCVWRSPALHQNWVPTKTFPPLQLTVRQQAGWERWAVEVELGLASPNAQVGYLRCRPSHLTGLLFGSGRRSHTQRLNAHGGRCRIEICCPDSTDISRSARKSQPPTKSIATLTTALFAIMPGHVAKLLSLARFDAARIVPLPAKNLSQGLGWRCLQGHARYARLARVAAAVIYMHQ